MRYLFWLSIVVVVYTYVGYPLLALLLGRLRRRRVDKGDYAPPVSILIAAHNEAQSLRATVENKLRLEYPGPVQIIVVSDGSNDGTDDIAREFEDRGVLLLRQEPRRGKTAALNLAA